MEELGICVSPGLQGVRWTWAEQAQDKMGAVLVPGALLRQCLDSFLPIYHPASHGGVLFNGPVTAQRVKPAVLARRRHCRLGDM